MGLFSQMGDMYKLQKEAKRIKKELENLHVYSEEDGVKVTVSGEMQIIGIEISEEAKTMDMERLMEIIKRCTNKAFKKAQEMSSKMMQDVMGGTGFPGMG